MTRLKALLEADGIEYTEREFNTNAGVAELGPNPFVSHVHIICRANHDTVYIIARNFWPRISQMNSICEKNNLWNFLTGIYY